jgi:hypothetical protein
MLKKCIYSSYSPLSSTHILLRCSNFFNLSKKNSFGCVADRKIGNRKSQRHISTLTYMIDYSCMKIKKSKKINSPDPFCGSFV